MSMPIQRQSEQFSAFDTGTRWARDRSSTDLPKGLAGLINSTGPRIQAGLLNTRTAGEKLQPGPWTGEDWERAENHDPTDAYRDHPDSWSHQPTEQDYADWEARRNRTAADYNFGKGPRDHGGAGPDGGPSVPDWYYDEENEDDGDPPDPPGSPREDPWGHHAGSRHPFDRAAARRLIAFDWKNEKYEGKDGEDFPEGHWRARLENGHHLNTYRVQRALGSRPEQWAWSIYTPIPDDPQGAMTMAEGGGHRHGEEFASREHAQRAAEDAYQRMYPIGTDTGGHDSGVNYSDLGSFMRHLESMRRKAGDGMSYEDAMAHIDDVLAGGEGHKMHDVPGVDRSLMRDHISEGFDADGYCPDCERTFVEGHEPGFLCNEQNEDTPRTWNASQRTAAGWADWRRVPHNDPDAIKWMTDRYDDDSHAEGNYHHYKAPLENGKEMHVFTDDSYHHEIGWSWMVGDRGAPHHETNSVDYGYDAGGGLDTPHLPSDGSTEHLRHIKTKEEAMRRAEDSYEQMFPVGKSDTGPHNSGVDYDQFFNKGRQDLDDEDFGHIFGSRRTAAGVAVDPAAQQQMMVPDGGGYQPGHRVGLPWRDTVIPGTVIGVDGPQVVIRWDEGQYSNEEPRNIQLL